MELFFYDFTIIALRYLPSAGNCFDSDYSQIYKST